MKKYSRYAAILILFITVFSCSNKGNQIIGTWENDLGQTLIFKDDNSAFWLFSDGDKTDTFRIKYRTDFDQTPINLDLYDFSSGPLQGQSLFGIVKFDDNSFLCGFEAGTDHAIRPATFDPEQSQTYTQISK